MRKIFSFFGAALLACVQATAAFSQTYSIQQYLNIRSATAPAFSSDGAQIAYLTNISGTNQVWIVDTSGGKPRQLTNYDDAVSFVRWAGDGLIFGKAKGGDENTQFYWMRPDGTDVKRLTNDPAVRHNFGDVSWDGKSIYFKRNGGLWRVGLMGEKATRIYDANIHLIQPVQLELSVPGACP